MWCVRSFYVMCFCVRPNHSHAKRLGTRPASLLFHGLLASKEPVAVVLRSCPSETLKPFGSSRPSVLCPSLQARSFHGITASASRQAQTALSAQEPSPPPHLWFLAPPASSTCHLLCRVASPPRQAPVGRCLPSGSSPTQPC